MTYLKEAPIGTVMKANSDLHCGGGFPASPSATWEGDGLTSQEL